MKSQLKRVDGEVNAFASRIRDFDKKLEESEKYVRLATEALADAVALQIEVRVVLVFFSCRLYRGEASLRLTLYVSLPTH